MTPQEREQYLKELKKVPLSELLAHDPREPWIEDSLDEWSEDFEESA